MDSYQQAKEKLDLITSEEGWYVYCIEEEEWHLYSEEGVLIHKAPTIEELVECSSPDRYWTNLSGNHNIRPQVGIRAEQPPIHFPPLDSYEERGKLTHGQDPDSKDKP